MVAPQPPDTRKTRRERQAETRQQVVEAGRTLFLERGYHATTLAAVVAAAGFTKGAVYSNFASKTELALAVIEDLERENLARLAAAVTGVSDPVQRGELLKTWGESLLADMPLIRLRAEVNFVALDDAELAQILAAKSRAVRQLVANLLREVHDPAELLFDPDVLADVLTALANGVGLARLIDPEFDLQRFVDVSHLLTGVTEPQRQVTR